MGRGGQRRRLRLYGSARWLPDPVWRLLLPVLACTRRVYARLAREAPAGLPTTGAPFTGVVAVVGVDGSPSCGVT